MGVLRRHPFLLGVAFVIFLVVAVLSATSLAVWRAAHRDDTTNVDRADVIMVLGAAQYAGRPSPVFMGRLEHAALLYQKGFAGTVLVVGGGRPGDITTEADAGREWLVSKGVPEEAVVAEPKGGTTFESLRYAADYLRAHGLSSAFLVSDPWHNLRIKRMASDLGIEAHVSATWHSAAKSQWTRLSGYSRETFAYLYYRMFGR